jgi:hypothetical protein
MSIDEQPHLTLAWIRGLEGYPFSGPRAAVMYPTAGLHEGLALHYTATYNFRVVL